LHADCFTSGLDGNHDGHFFIWGNFVEVYVQKFSGERVMLDFLNESEAFWIAVVFDRKVNEKIFRNGMVQKVFDFDCADFQIPGFNFAPVNDGGNSSGLAKVSCSVAPRLRARKCVQWYRFHFLIRSGATPTQLVRPPLNSS